MYCVQLHTLWLVNIIVQGVKSTPMHLAAVSGYEEVVQLLASKGARVDCKDVVSSSYTAN